MQIASSSTKNDLLRCILWQYDHAPNLLALISGLNDIANVATDEFWQKFITDVLNVDTASMTEPFIGLDTLGRIIGVPRPVTAKKYGDPPQPHVASDDFYRRILKAHLYLSFADASCASIAKYLVILFGAQREITIPSPNYSVGDSVEIGGITYTFIPAAAEYGALNEVKLGANASGTATNLAAVVNGEDGYKLGEDGGQQHNPNVSTATASGSVVTLAREFWYADGKSAEAAVTVVDNADMTIDYRVASPTSLTEEEQTFLFPIDSTTNLVRGGRCLGYTLAGERIYGFTDPGSGEITENPAFPVLFPFPAGVRSSLATQPEDYSPLGLNETENFGQNRANFVFSQSQTNGAPYDGGSTP